MNRQRYTAALAALLLLAAPLHAQAPDGVEDEILEEVVVVGTRRGAESTRSLAVPVDVLDAEQLVGQGDMLDVLTARVPPYNVNREPISDAATLVRPANLRGLLRMNYYDDVYEHLFNCESCAITTDAMSVFDAEVSWAVSGTYAVALGVQNLLDKLPDEHQFAGVAGYLGADFPLNHPSGLNGGSYYLRLNAEF